MADFCTVEDLEQLLQVEIETEAQVAGAERACKDATAAILNYCHQVIELVTNETITRDCAGGTQFFLPELPVVSVAEVVEDDEVLVEGDDYKLGDYGILHRVDAKWAVGVQIVEVTYSHGLAAPLPDDLVGVCTRAAARQYQAGLKAASTDGVPGISSLSLGDYSVGYTESLGSEGMGGARILLLSEKDFLDKYRYVAQ